MADPQQNEPEPVAPPGYVLFKKPNVGGNAPHYVNLAVGAAVAYALYTHAHGQVLDWSLIPQMANDLLSNPTFLLVAPTLSLIYSGVKKILASNHNKQVLAIKALTETVNTRGSGLSFDPAEMQRLLTAIRGLADQSAPEPQAAPVPTPTPSPSQQPPQGDQK
jgi:hypothetical protein